MEKLELYLSSQLKKTPDFYSRLILFILIALVSVTVSSLMGCSIFPY